MRLEQTLRKKGTIPKLDGGGHVEHHAETYDDMLLKTDDPVWMKSAPAQRLNSDPWRGTIFTWQVTAMMFAQCIPSVYPAFYALGWDAASTTALFVPAMILHGLVWNSLHPDMHGLPDVPASVGLPSSVMAGFRGSPVFEWLRLNHVGHHVASGQVHPTITGLTYTHGIWYSCNISSAASGQVPLTIKEGNMYPAPFSYSPSMRHAPT